VNIPRLLTINFEKSFQPDRFGSVHSTLCAGYSLESIQHHTQQSQAGKWPLITDLSFPEGHSVNDAISTDACTLRYTYISVNQVALAAVQLDQGALLAKTDIKTAYRLVRVWLAMKWQGAIMLMPCSHSASGLFLSCPMQWLMYWNGAPTNGVSILSATTCGNRPPGSSLCQEYLLVLSIKNVNTWVSCWQLRKEKVLAQ